MSRKDHRNHDAALEQRRKEHNISQEVTTSKKLWAFVESPILWGAVGMVGGAISSALSIKWFFFLAWILIGIALVHTRFWAGKPMVKQVIGNSSLCVLMGLVLLSLWRVMPKPKGPPTPDQIADAMVTRMGGSFVLPNQGQPLPPTITTVTVDGSAQDVIAEKVIQKLSQMQQH